MSGRVYLDWNATAPLRPEARAAMLEAMDAVGNPSSVHAEGRAARAIVERARGQVAGLVGCAPDEVVFTSGATEATQLADSDHVTVGADIEHDCVFENLLSEWRQRNAEAISVDRAGRIDLAALGLQFDANFGTHEPVTCIAVIAAQNETGVIQDVGGVVGIATDRTPSRCSATEVLCDAVQLVGRMPFHFADSGVTFALLSGHKLGGPKGAGALVAKHGVPGVARHT
ncbi:MAG: aminotransferase class V-fold PLP-dependent enzyme, partial [Pseudomonadota bacterium]